jgi:hypothetical protein
MLTCKRLPLVRITSSVAEFGVANEGKVALIHRALYGGKSAGRDSRNHLRSCMHHIGFKSCPADPDVWMRSAIKSDGTNVYGYVLLYTDDALSIGVEAESILRKEIGGVILTSSISFVSRAYSSRSIFVFAARTVSLSSLRLLIFSS